MILLDTNVVSEMMKPQPEPNVQGWLNTQVAGSLHFSSISLAELLFGIKSLPVGKRRDLLAASLSGLMSILGNRVLPFDAKAACYFADLAAAAKQAGKGFPRPDGYIAATAAARGFVVASRDTAPYKAAGVSVINPWNP